MSRQVNRCLVAKSRVDEQVGRQLGLQLVSKHAGR